MQNAKCKSQKIKLKNAERVVFMNLTLLIDTNGFIPLFDFLHFAF